MFPNYRRGSHNYPLMGYHPWNYRQEAYHQEAYRLSLMPYQSYGLPHHHQQPLNPNLEFYHSNMGYPFQEGSYMNGQQPMMNTPYPNPYPTNINSTPQQPAGFQSFMSQFQKQDGTYDINKMMDTAGQMMGAVNQLGGLVKGFKGVFKP